jgi:hypothetical protein
MPMAAPAVHRKDAPMNESSNERRRDDWRRIHDKQEKAWRRRCDRDFGSIGEIHGPHVRYRYTRGGGGPHPDCDRRADHGPGGYDRNRWEPEPRSWAREQEQPREPAEEPASHETKWSDRSNRNRDPRGWAHRFLDERWRRDVADRWEHDWRGSNRDW